MKCANCEKDAVYTYDDKASNPTDYCHECLPAWLHNRAAAGEFGLVTEPIEEVRPKTSKKKIEEPVVEEPVVEAAADESN